MNVYDSIAALTISTVSAAALAGPVPAGDILISIDDGQLATGLIAEDRSFVVPGVRVFGAELGRTGVPFFADEPGLQVADGTFDPLALLGFDVLTSLARWNGDGFDALNPSAAESMNISFAGGALSATTSTGFVKGFDLATDNEGGLHDHLEFTLLGPTGGDPTLGIYLLELQFRTSMTGITSSAPTWIVFNNGLLERDHEAAFDWVSGHLVPAPAALPLLGISILLPCSRARKSGTGSV